jgi:hypothetical protein
MSEQGRLSRLRLGTPKLEDRCPVVFSGREPPRFVRHGPAGMRVPRDVLPRFLFLYGTLYGSFGLASPFLPAFLAARGVGPEALGLLLGAGTAARLLSASLAGRVIWSLQPTLSRAQPQR